LQTTLNRHRQRSFGTLKIEYEYEYENENENENEYEYDSESFSVRWARRRWEGDC
jgi:hypothetical protein